jgi:hypothetical protein
VAKFNHLIGQSIFPTKCCNKKCLLQITPNSIEKEWAANAKLSEVEVTEHIVEYIRHHTSPNGQIQYEFEGKPVCRMYGSFVLFLLLMCCFGSFQINWDYL